MTTMAENERRQRIAFALFHRGMSIRQIADLLGVSYQVVRHCIRPAQWAAQVSLNKALGDGLVEKPDNCAECGTRGKRLMGHHDDYNELYRVRWLCSPCHSRIHPGARQPELGATLA